MSHFGIVCPPVSGHIQPMAVLGRELVARGHRVTCFALLDLEAQIQREGLEFRPIGHREFPRGSLVQWTQELPRRHGLSAVRFTVGAVARTSEAVCRDLPHAAREHGINAFLIDQMEPAGGAVADHLGLPFATVCCALAINRDDRTPPAFSPWMYRDSWWAGIRSRAGYAISDWLTRPISRVVAEYRARWKLPALGSPDDSFSKLAQICQMPQEFDFPRAGLPKTFHYVGPLRDERQRDVAFPWDRLDGRPLVYASLGTLQNNREAVFRCFAEACDGLGVQLVISHGGGLAPSQESGFPGDPLIVAYAPQRDLLARACLTITHAGLNTVLDSLAAGVPMVAVPITYEQPAIARRLERAGAGIALGLAKLGAPRLKNRMREVLSEARFAEAAARMSAAIRRAGGVRRGAEIAETLV